MVWFQCEDCGESLKKGKLSRHSRFCTATKLSCIDCGNMFGQDTVQYHNQCLTEAEKYGPKRPSNGYNLKQQQLDYDINADLFNSPSSLCKANMTCEQDYISHDYGTNHREKAKEVDFDINVGLSNHYPWLCSLCNIKATSQQNLLSHANGKKHQAATVKWFDANQQLQQPKHSTVEKKDNSREQTEVDIHLGLSSHHPWFCSLCNTKATCQQNLLSHANGRKHRENVELFDAKQKQLEKSTVDDKKDKIENASDGVANGGYSQADKKRKLETFNEIWNGDVVQAEEAKGRSEEKSESKKAKKQYDEKKEKTDTTQTKSDSDLEYDKEDIKLLLVSYSKEELVNLIYKTAEKGSRLISAILESADRDIAQRNIFVRGFGWDTTHENLRAAFESYGEIEECSVVMDKNTGRGKGYGFVLFKTRKGAREALKNPEKRMYNRIVVCNLASEKPCRAEKVQEMVEPVKTDLTKMANQSEATFPGLELSHGHVLENRHQQQTMDMYRKNIPFYEHSQLPGFDPMYGALSGNQMVAGLPNYGMFGSGCVNQGSMLPPPNHMGMAGQYFGDGGHAWYQR